MTIKRGRKSAADLSIVKVSGARVPPPEHLTAAQRDEWLLIVNSLPADYFRPGDAPLLGAFCAASALYKEALLMIQAEGIVLDNGSRRYAHPAKDILTSQGASMAQMAVKLRLCQSARYTEKSAQTKTAAGSTKARPWEVAS